jgi:hypothetical protein
VETVIEQCSLIGLKYRNGPLSRICIIIISEGCGKKELGP